MRRFFIDFDVYPPEWHGLNREAVAMKIEAALESIRVNDLDTLKAEYDAANGWGSVEGAIEFLEAVKGSCRREVSETVEVWW